MAWTSIKFPDACEQLSRTMDDINKKQKYRTATEIATANLEVANEKVQNELIHENMKKITARKMSSNVKTGHWQNCKCIGCMLSKLPVAKTESVTKAAARIKAKNKKWLPRVLTELDPTIKLYNLVEPEQEGPYCNFLGRPL